MKRKALEIVTYLLIISVFLTNFNQNFIFGKFDLSFFRIMLVIVILFYSISKIKINLRVFRLEIIFPLVWLIYSIFSVLWVKNYIFALKDLYFIILFNVISIIIVINIRNNRFRKNFLRIILLTSIVHIAVGTFEINTGNYLFLGNEINKISNYQRGKYAVSTFTNINNYSFYMYFIMLSSVLGIIKFKKSIFRLLGIIIFFASLFLIINNESRAVIISTILSGMVLLGIFIYNTRYKNFLYIVIPVSVLLAILLIFNNINLDSSNSDITRLKLMQAGFKALVDTFFMGTGIGNLNFYMQDFIVDGTVSIHNWWIEIITTFGLFIFSIYLYMFLRALYYNVYMYSKNKNYNSMIYIVAMIGFVFIVIGPSSIFKMEWFWVLKSYVIIHTSYMYKETLYFKDDK